MASSIIRPIYDRNLPAGIPHRRQTTPDSTILAGALTEDRP
jgi:hypothetical protein